MKQLLGMTLEELQNELRSLGQPSYRAAQIQQWLYLNTPFEEMSNLPAALREELREKYEEGYAQIVEKKSGKDGTTKYLLELTDGNTIETVFLPYDYGNTLCVSTQVGCAMGCKFCASCKDGLIRDLTAGEMLSEVTAVSKDQGERVSRIVLMGMGEPLKNTDQVLRFLSLASDKDGLGIGRRNMTLSTCGVVDQMDRLAEESPQTTLAVSLHAPSQAKREKMMPSAKKYPIQDIVDAAERYFEKTGRRVTFEYALVRGVNDSEQDLRQLAKLLGPLHTHINIIPLNSYGDLKGPTRKQAYAFADRLTKLGVPATVRRTMGQDIEGACGQLRQRAASPEAEEACAAAQ